ncbi:hypothetical protein BT96DRAFT_693422 [Gymnopus androsaceus JB14]|uniref:Uncharacterized protein n=1 Tax=Gymnopus androsaceus JB14 TaxID=1447944 RepID=A0A6A4HNE6_9AGAR|nr:hypothetical protein BT96DRAFT_693422 [Gymnopus androsaceus JB14]
MISIPYVSAQPHTKQPSFIHDLPSCPCCYPLHTTTSTSSALSRLCSLIFTAKRRIRSMMDVHATTTTTTKLRALIQVFSAHAACVQKAERVWISKEIRRRLMCNLYYLLHSLTGESIKSRFIDVDIAARDINVPNASFI